MSGYERGHLDYHFLFQAVVRGALSAGEAELIFDTLQHAEMARHYFYRYRDAVYRAGGEAPQDLLSALPRLSFHISSAGGLRARLRIARKEIENG